LLLRHPRGSCPRSRLLLRHPRSRLLLYSALSSALLCGPNCGLLLCYSSGRLPLPCTRNRLLLSGMQTHSRCLLQSMLLCSFQLRHLLRVEQLSGLRLPQRLLLHPILSLKQCASLALQPLSLRQLGRRRLGQGPVVGDDLLLPPLDGRGEVKIALALRLLLDNRLVQSKRPLRMALLYIVWIAGAPPVEIMPLMALVISAVPVGMMLTYPVRIAHLPPLVAVPDVTVVEVAPPVRMILAHPIRILRPPIRRRIPYAIAIEVAPPLGIIH
jgi:hypothetical protein